METVGDKLGSVINTFNDQRVKQLVVDGDAGVAITAAWELVRRSDALKSDRPSVAALSWFVGLVEGRTGCVVPSLWKRCVESAKRDEGRYTFSTRDMVAFLAGESDVYPWPVNEPTVKCNSDVCRVRGDGMECVVDSHGESPQSAAMRKAGDATFLVLYNQVVEKYPLYALDRAGALKWEQDVNPKYVQRFVGGFVWHQVDIEVGNGMVCVFGVAGDVLYMESFGVSDGTRLWGFSSAALENER